ncbi:uncharacterized protein LOC143735486 [Siphateles boraxobius]|uniref:uncharacterized protein LOC143735486 n=1 Tax=Siphateles boraxobius TaxID=180520 RepID=UPI004062C70D
MNVKIHEITYSPAERYRERLHLENQTGYLTIRDLRTADAGVYQLQISNTIPDPGLSADYIVLICVFLLLCVAVVLGLIYYQFIYSKRKDKKKTVSVTEGNSVTLNTATEIQREDEVLWTFGPQDMVIAQIYKKAGNICYTNDEQFSDKLQLDQQTGDLTISDIRIRISGDYQMRITGSRATKIKRFKVIVRVDTLKFTEGESLSI